MNIIKLQDKIMPEGCQKAAFFNKYLKGKYAYWVHMRYIVPLETMSHQAYVACEEDITKLLINDNGEYPRPYGTEYLDLYDHIIDLYDNRELNILEYIDSKETDCVNNTHEYMLKNTYITDEDITLGELKKFRTWLAQSMLLFDTNSETGENLGNVFSEDEFHVLNYYANGMMDQTIHVLLKFGSPTFTVEQIKTNTCGCHQSSNLSSLYNSQELSCDPIVIYKNNIYKKMVSVFSSIDFWTRFSKEYILTVKHYIDNIISVGLPLSKNNYEAYKDCSCVKDDAQNNGIEILKKLSTSLEYIYNGDVNGHKNYISDSLHKWSSELYEHMEW